MEKADLKALTALLTGLAGVATAIASCNASAQDRLKADNKIYTTLAESITKRDAEIMELHRQLDEQRGYLQALRASTPPTPAASGSVPVTIAPTPLRRTFRLNGLALAPLTSASAAPANLPAPPPDLPAPAPAPKLRPLPTFDAL